MIAGSTVKGDFDSVKSYFENYETEISNLASSWEGASYNNMKKVTSDFINGTLPVIEETMGFFADACDEYAIYEKNKEVYLDCVSQVTEYTKAINGMSQQDKVDYPFRYQNYLNKKYKYEKKRDEYKEKLKKNVKTLKTLLTAAKLTVDSPPGSLVSYSIEPFKYEVSS